MMEQAAPPRTMHIVLQQYRRGGVAVAIAYDGQAASTGSADACFSSLDEAIQMIVLPDATRYFGVPALRFYGQQPQMPFPAAAPSLPTVSEEPTGEDMPSVINGHQGHAQGLVERVRGRLNGSAMAFAWFLAVGASMAMGRVMGA